MRRLMLGLMICLMPGFAWSADVPRPDDARALQGLADARILWDVTLSEPEKLLSRLGVIEQTYRDLEQQGVEPKMLFVFHGGAVKLLTRDAPDRQIGNAQTILQIHDKLQELAALEGVERLEACSIATRRVGVTQADLVEPVVEVGNTFVTVAAYAQRGYAKIKID